MATETVNLDLSSARVFRAFQPVTNSEDWITVLKLFNGGTAFDLDGWTAAMSVRAPCGCEVFTATGVASDDDDAVTSILTFTVRAASLASLDAGAHMVSVRITDGTNTRQVVNAKLPVRDGGFA